MVFDKNNWGAGISWPAVRYKGCDKYRDKLSDAKIKAIDIVLAESNSITWLIDNDAKAKEESAVKKAERILAPLRALFKINSPLQGDNLEKHKGSQRYGERSSKQLYFFMRNLLP